MLGTLNNCASSQTPWGTYLTGEENFAFYFDAGDKPDAHQLRWGLRKTSFYRWPEHDERFDATKIRTSRTASGGWSRSILSTRPARRSSVARSVAQRTKARGSR